MTTLDRVSALVAAFQANEADAATTLAEIAKAVETSDPMDDAPTTEEMRERAAALVEEWAKIEIPSAIAHRIRNLPLTAARGDSGPLPLQDRERLGRMVRNVWISWAREQTSPKASWLVPWEGLAEPDREVDRRIGEALFAEGLAARGDGAPTDMDPVSDAEIVEVAQLVRAWKGGDDAKGIAGKMATILPRLAREVVRLRAVDARRPAPVSPVAPTEDEAWARAAEAVAALSNAESPLPGVDCSIAHGVAVGLRLRDATGEEAKRLLRSVSKPIADAICEAHKGKAGESADTAADMISRVWAKARAEERPVTLDDFRQAAALEAEKAEKQAQWEALCDAVDEIEAEDATEDERAAVTRLLHAAGYTYGDGSFPALRVAALDKVAADIKRLNAVPSEDERAPLTEEQLDALARAMPDVVDYDRATPEQRREAVLDMLAIHGPRQDAPLTEAEASEWAVRTLCDPGSEDTASFANQHYEVTQALLAASRGAVSPLTEEEAMRWGDLHGRANGRHQDRTIGPILFRASRGDIPEEVRQSTPDLRRPSAQPLDAATQTRLDAARVKVAEHIAPTLAALEKAGRVTAADLAVTVGPTREGGHGMVTIEKTWPPREQIDPRADGGGQ